MIAVIRLVVADGREKTLMKNLRLLFILAVAALPLQASAQTPHIDPAGIHGAILVCNGEVSDAVIEKFFDLAGGTKAKIAVVHANADKPAAQMAERLAEIAKKKEAVEPRLLDWKKTEDALSGFSGVWLLASPETAQPAPSGLFAVLKRSGVVALNDIHAERNTDLLPPNFHDRRHLVKKPLGKGVVQFEVDAGSALLIRGRTLTTVGTGSTEITLKEPNRTISLKGKTQEDLIALLRAARDGSDGFPPKTPAAPVVEKGTLVIVGGGGLPDGLFKKFVEYAGGAGKAKIVIFPTAAESPLTKRDSVADAFKKAGAAKATILYGRTQAEVESKEFLDALKEATGLWFDGGRQWRFVDCYEDTKALPLMFDVLKRGGVIGGTSAGATIQGEYLCRGGVFNNFDIRYEGYERGLGFLKGVAIDQHFTQRKRQSEMTSLMKTYPQYLGIGLDEATAIVVKGSVADVIGKGKVHFYDANRKVEKGEPDYEALSAGGRYDLKERKVLAGDK
jgi:cyanophycinase